MALFIFNEGNKLMVACLHCTYSVSYIQDHIKVAITFDMMFAERNKVKSANSIQSKNEEKSKFVKTLQWIAYIAITCVALYWTIEVLTTYFSYPVSTSVTLEENDTYTWPILTVCPRQNCLNETIVSSMSEEYNLTYLNLTYWDSYPFDPEEGNFDWKNQTYHEILWKAKYRNIEDIIKTCYHIHTHHFNSTSPALSDCFNSALGSWKTYTTQDGVCHSFHPIPAVDIGNYIEFRLSHKKCTYITVALHSSHEVFQMEDSPFIFTHNLKADQSYNFITGVRLFTQVNRKSSQCTVG